jgi:hypothetical protein
MFYPQELAWTEENLRACVLPDGGGQDRQAADAVIQELMLSTEEHRRKLLEYCTTVPLLTATPLKVKVTSGITVPRASTCHRQLLMPPHLIGGSPSSQRALHEALLWAYEIEKGGQLGEFTE